MTEPPSEYYKRGTADLEGVKERELVSRLELLSLLAEGHGVLAELENSRPQELSQERLWVASDRLKLIAEKIANWRL